MPSLGLTLHSLRAEVADFLGIGRDAANWSADEIARLDSYIASGLRSFYYPPSVQGERPHQWSFFKPVYTLTLTVGTSAYDMPADFAYLAGPVTLSDGTRQWSVRLAGETQVRGAALLASTVPRYVAVVPKVSTGAAEQGYQLLVSPPPDVAYVLTFRYAVMPQAFSTYRPVPLGGAVHAETIREACLAAAETDADDTVGAHAAKFEQRLTASIQQDKAVSTADYYGYNGDRSNEPGRVVEPDQVVSLNGVPIT